MNGEEVMNNASFVDNQCSVGSIQKRTNVGESCNNDQRKTRKQ